MNVVGPTEVKLVLNGFVVSVGFLILAGAVNTAIIGSNGVLNRVAEDGVLPEWSLKPHPHYGTTYRILYLILILQLVTIVVSRGNVLVLGEAYAFGVVWSFVFKALAMVVLRFKEPGPRAYRVPLNFRLGHYDVPVGLGLIFLVLLASALMNLLTKEVATKWGMGFTAAFLTIFLVSERYHPKRRREAGGQHLDQFNQQTVSNVTPESLGLAKPYRQLVAIRSIGNLYILEKVLEETDTERVDLIVMHAKFLPPMAGHPEQPELDVYDQQLMTAVVERAERAGKSVMPLIVPTNHPMHAILKTAQALRVQELVLEAPQRLRVLEVIPGMVPKPTPGTRQARIASYWLKLHGGQPAPLTVRVLSRDRDTYLDLYGGQPILQRNVAILPPQSPKQPE